jgi:Sulfatase
VRGAWARSAGEHVARDIGVPTSGPHAARMPSYRMRFVHLTAIWAFAVSQPIYSLLSGNEIFLAAHGMTRVDVVACALMLSLGPPALAVAAQWLASKVSEAAANVVHVLALIAFLIPLAMQLVNRLDPATPERALMAAWILSVAGAAVYVMSRTARLFVSFSVVLAIAGLLLFVSAVPVAARTGDVVALQPARRPSIVTVVFDELPLGSLMTPSGRIDVFRYPAFGRLAHDGTWYRNATTVHDFTTYAVPAILTGRRQPNGLRPLVSDHPQNLFTLLGSAYSMHVREEWTRLCPLSLCPRDRASIEQGLHVVSYEVAVAYLHRILPSSLQGPLPPPFSAFDSRPFHDFASSVSEDRGGGVLHFIHVVLPHFPWRFLPSGHTYRKSRLPPGLDSSDLSWANKPSYLQQAYQAHLLQVGYADTLLGQLLGQLERAGLYDESLVLVLADHGASFRPGGYFRQVDRDNLADVASVPLLIKYPHQRRGRVDARTARTIDVLPTIADVLGFDMPWRVDGRSLIGAPVQDRDVVMQSVGGRVVRARANMVARELETTVRRKTALFGEGNQSLYWLGAGRSLDGRDMQTVPQRRTDVRVRLDNDERFLNVSKGSAFVPALISGRVESGAVQSGGDLAIAINDRLVARTECFTVNGIQRFRALVPEESFRAGYNRVDVYLFRDDKPKAAFVWLGRSAGDR